MKAPKPLCAGDLVAIAAPARYADDEWLQPAVRTLEGWGLRVLLPDGLMARDGQLAGPDAHRAALFQQLVDNPEVRAILCARGGYGTARIVDGIDFSPLRRDPKWVVGYSDITVLHSHLHALFGLPTLHATMPVSFPATHADGNASVASLRSCLFGQRPSYAWQGGALCRAGEAEAPVVGGNLSVLYSLCGSPSAISTRGKILLLEDLDEYLYHIDRMMLNLRRNGLLDGLAGLVVGGMLDMHDNSVPFCPGEHPACRIVSQAVAPYAFPVAFQAPFGHDPAHNLALPLGLPARFRVLPDGTASLSVA